MRRGLLSFTIGPLHPVTLLLHPVVSLLHYYYTPFTPCYTTIAFTLVQPVAPFYNLLHPCYTPNSPITPHYTPNSPLFHLHYTLLTPITPCYTPHYTLVTPFLHPIAPLLHPFHPVIPLLLDITPSSHAVPFLEQFVLFHHSPHSIHDS